MQTPLAQLSAIVEGAFSKHADTAGDERLLYRALLEPLVSDRLEAVRKAERAILALAEPELFWRLHLGRKPQVFDSRPRSKHPSSGYPFKRTSVSALAAEGHVSDLSSEGGAANDASTHP